MNSPRTRAGAEGRTHDVHARTKMGWRCDAPPPHCRGSKTSDCRRRSLSRHALRHFLEVLIEDRLLIRRQDGADLRLHLRAELAHLLHGALAVGLHELAHRLLLGRVLLRDVLDLRLLFSTQRAVDAHQHHVSATTAGPTLLLLGVGDRGASDNECDAERRDANSLHVTGLMENDENTLSVTLCYVMT